MSDLIKLAKQLADEPTAPLYVSVKGRVAYMLDHALSSHTDGYAVRTQGVAEALNEHGFETLCFVRPHQQFGANKANSVTPQTKIDGVRYFHSSWPSHTTPLDEVEKLKSTVACFEEHLRVFRPAAVVAASNWRTGLPAWIAAKRLKLPFYNEVRGFWELSRDAKEPGYVKTEAFKRNSARDTFVATQADRLFTLNQPMRQELVRQGVCKDRIDLIPNGIGKFLKKDVAYADLAHKLGIESNDKVIGYLGSFNPYEGLQSLVDACRQLASEGEKIKLLLVGDDPQVSKYDGKREPFAVAPWLISAGRVLHKHVAAYYSLIDLVVIPRKKLPVCELVPPIKAVEALARGKRMLVSDVAPLLEYRALHGNVATFRAGDNQSFLDELRDSLQKDRGEAVINDFGFYNSVSSLACELLSVEKRPKNTGALLPTSRSQWANSNSNLRVTERYRHAKRIVDEPRLFRFNVEPLTPHSVTGKIVCESSDSRIPDGFIMRVRYIDSAGDTLPAPYYGLSISKGAGAFSYLDVKSKQWLRLIPPKGSAEVELGIQRWSARGAAFIDGALACQCELEGRRTEDGITTLHKPATVAAPKRPLSDLRIAGIMDEFTRDCFRHEVKLTSISPDNWEEELESAAPDMLFVESCWFGNRNQWAGLIYGYTANGPNKMEELIKVTNYCRRHGIPTVFWSKEDPVHYNRFGPTAKLFDYVYTSDANMVPHYKEDYDIDTEFLCFFCQPRVHNPAPIIARNQKAAFAGSYYAKKKERCEDFFSIMRGLEKAGVDYDIFDRCLKRGISHLQFPEHFKKHVVGYLEPEEMWQAYKGYRFTVNLNTVKHSPTMFARRVYESLASGTPVVSNYSEGVITQFGGIVCASDNMQDVVDHIERLKDPAEYQLVREMGTREALGHHTLADRLEKICDRLGILVKPHLPITNAIYTAGSEPEVDQARTDVQRQSYTKKRLVVNLENSNVLYPYLNRNSDDEIFRVLTEFTQPLDGLNVEMGTLGQSPTTLLEDEAIKTQYDNANTDDVKSRIAI